MLVVAASEGKCDGEQDEGKEVEAINAELELELAFAVHAPNSKARVQAVPIEVSSAASSAPRLEFSPAEYASLTERKTGFASTSFLAASCSRAPLVSCSKPPPWTPTALLRHSWLLSSRVALMIWCSSTKSGARLRCVDERAMQHRMHGAARLRNFTLTHRLEAAGKSSKVGSRVARRSVTLGHFGQADARSHTRSRSDPVPDAIGSPIHVRALDGPKRSCDSATTAGSDRFRQLPSAHILGSSPHFRRSKTMRIRSYIP